VIATTPSSLDSGGILTKYISLSSFWKGWDFLALPNGTGNFLAF